MKEIWFLRYHFADLIGCFERYFSDELSVSRWVARMEISIGSKIIIDDIFVISLTEVPVE